MYSKPLSNIKYEKFIKAIFDGKTKAEAYEFAFGPGKNDKYATAYANRLLRNPEISMRLEELHEQTLQESKLSKKFLLDYMYDAISFSPIDVLNDMEKLRDVGHLIQKVKFDSDGNMREVEFVNKLGMYKLGYDYHGLAGEKKINISGGININNVTEKIADMISGFDDDDESEFLKKLGFGDNENNNDDNIIDGELVEDDNEDGEDIDFEKNDEETNGIDDYFINEEKKIDSDSEQHEKEKIMNGNFNVEYNDNQDDEDCSYSGFGHCLSPVDQERINDARKGMKFRKKSFDLDDEYNDEGYLSGKKMDGGSTIYYDDE